MTPPQDFLGRTMSSLLLLGQTESRTEFEWARLEDYTERWHFLVLGLVCAAVVAFIGWMYRRDAIELGPVRRWFLLTLRVIAFAGLLIYYLDPVKRTEQKQVRNSRVLVLVDTSMSMGLHDAEGSAIPATPTRLEQVASVLETAERGGSGLLAKLREKHDIVVARFDSELSRVQAIGKIPKQTATDGDNPITTEKPIDWKAALVPQGSETRLGQSLRQLVSEERTYPVAGIIVFTDGDQNAGIDPNVAIDTAREAKIPIYAVGIGSEKRPANVRISDFVAPARAYPGDRFTVTGYIQAQELADRAVTVELTSRPAGAGNSKEEGKLEGSERISLAAKGEVVPIKFEIAPEDAGRRTFRLSVKAPSEDTNPADDQQEADVEIVDRKTRVLLLASGPSREYVFLRNQLRRDREMIVDVWLQSGQAGMSQDANAMLESFPSTPQELFEYDAIVAFDPDWQQLDEGEIDLLERWVAEKAGGLVAIAGPVEMGRWLSEQRMAKIRSLYPVEVNRRLSLVEETGYGSDTPWPVDFTREGMESEFLWLADSPTRSQQIWTEFPGVYSYYAVRGAKPGATVFARFSDPAAIGAGSDPIYMAEQFFGSGRVFYLGSGEMWRLRALDDSYFEQFYTKLVRHVSQGRLLLGSSRGLLLVDRDRYVLGNTVALRANVFDAQFEPLALPTLPVQIVLPDSTVTTVSLSPDPNRKGMYTGQFTALQEGTYRIELAVPDAEGEQLTRRIQVKVPDLEREHPERNDALLSEIAKRTGGIYYVGADSVLGTRGMPPVVEQLKDRTEVTYLPGVVDREYEKHWMEALLAVVCGALCLEWLTRRLSKLA
jgi:hypothetical protein